MFRWEKAQLLFQDSFLNTGSLEKRNTWTTITEFQVFGITVCQDLDFKILIQEA